ncbi:hypothetical protein TWF730_005300 [Orbilia blumenaviensis]|uniref:Peptidase S8/S53 domain-containing protein n=1 Tax=Orbilia blumenaviensis TaxID=1796055 RepID=A0AAV9VP56_9PEZI
MRRHFYHSAFLLQVIFIWILALLADTAAAAATWQEELAGLKAKHLRPKIGTFGKVSSEFAFIISMDHRFNREKLADFIKTVKLLGTAPQNRSVHEIKSDDLGTWMITMEIPTKRFGKVINPIVDLFPQLISSKRWVASVVRQQYTPNGDELPWLKPLYYIDQNTEGNEPGEDTSHLGLQAIRSRRTELQIISQPPDVKSVADMEQFHYLEYYAGRRVIAYFIDSGLDLSHEIFDGIRSKLLSKSSRNWIFSSRMPSDERSDDHRPFAGFGKHESRYRESAFAHGTQVASQIIGTIGVAPHAEPIVVKLESGQGDITLTNNLECYLKIYDHMAMMRRERPDHYAGAVVVQTFGFGIDNDDLDGGEQNQYYVDFRALMLEILYLLGHNRNVYTFFAAGNGHPNEPIDSVPESWVLDAQNIAPKMSLRKAAVVGGVSTRTLLNSYQTGPGVRFFAPANDIAGPLFGVKTTARGGDFHFIHGTSFSTPLVAGLCARMITRGHLHDALDVMEALQYARAQGGPRVIWDGVRKSDWAAARLRTRMWNN